MLQLVITSGGVIRCLYSEQIDLRAFGQVTIARGSHVEPTAAGLWQADLAPVGGPLLGPFLLRSRALAAEQLWLEENWLVPPR